MDSKSFETRIILRIIQQATEGEKQKMNDSIQEGWWRMMEQKVPLLGFRLNGPEPI